MKFTNFIDTAHVRMIYGRAGAGFSQNALMKSLVGHAVIGGEFQRDMAAKPNVLRAEDYAHAAASYFADDAIIRNCLSRQILDHFMETIPPLRLTRASHQDGPGGVLRSAAHGLCRALFDNRFLSSSTFTQGEYGPQQRTENGELIGGWKVAETTAARTDIRFSIADCHD